MHIKPRKALEEAARILRQAGWAKDADIHPSVTEEQAATFSGSSSEADFIAKILSAARRSGVLPSRITARYALGEITSILREAGWDLKGAGETRSAPSVASVRVERPSS
jgi:hypothetical protein